MAEENNLQIRPVLLPFVPLQKVAMGVACGVALGSLVCLLTLVLLTFVLLTFVLLTLVMLTFVLLTLVMLTFVMLTFVLLT